MAFWATIALIRTQNNSQHLSPGQRLDLIQEIIFMGHEFNADDALAVAIQIEANGARFYRRAAELQSDETNRKKLEELAGMEDRHERIFQAMRANLPEAFKTPAVFDPMDDAAQYLAVMADTHGGEGTPELTDAITGRESMAEIIDTAIVMEKESVLFYLGLRDLVPPQHGQKDLDDIIREERQHIVHLTSLRREL
jgi:rubrerythrin